MKVRVLLAPACVLVVALLASPLASLASAQELRSAALAKELTTLLQEKQLDSIAARAPSASDEFVAALFLPGQLMVISARYSSPPLMMERLARSEYRDVYIDLNSAAVPESRVLITDLGADGLKPRRQPNEPFDAQDINGKAMRFDGNWRKDKMSEADYMKAFAEAEQNYAAALEVLIGALKKP